MNIVSRAFLYTLIFSSFAFAQAKEVTMEQIMAHPDWLGRQAENPYWADDGGSIYFERKVKGPDERRLYQVGLDGTGLRELSEFERAVADFVAALEGVAGILAVQADEVFGVCHL